MLRGGVTVRLSTSWKALREAMVRTYRISTVATEFIKQLPTMIAEENNVLLLGASDGRHLFETISTYDNEAFPKLTFW